MRSAHPFSLAILAIVLANTLAGGSYLAQKLALEGLPPATITLLRTLVALVAMGIWIRVRGGLSLDYTRREVARLFLLGNLSFAGPLLLGNYGVELSTATNGSILVLLEPGTILILSWWLLGENVRGRQIAGVGVGLVGALFVVLEDASALGLLAREHLTGNVLLAVHGILWGTYTPIARPLLVRHSPLDVTFLSMVFSLVVILPASLIESGEWHAGPALASSLAWTVALGLFASWLATFLWNYAVHFLEGKTVATFVFLQPVAGATVAWLVLGEALSRQAWIGAVLIASGVLLAVYGAGRMRRIVGAA